MLIDITLKELNNGEARVVRIFKNAGETVKAGEALFELEANKSNITVESEAEGKICKIMVEESQSVKAGDVLARIEGPPCPQAAAAEDTADFNYFGTLLKPQEQELECDITIIGGGPGGYVAAIQAAKMGAKVILIEKDVLGGTCLNRGCIPTKSLVRSAEIFKNLKEAEDFGCQAENISVDIKNVIGRKNRVITQLVQGIEYILKKHDVRVIRGIGEIKDCNTVFVKEKAAEITIKTNNIIIATGSKSSSLPIPGKDLECVMDSSDALQMDELPEKMVIIGGGVIGMEFAFIFSGFGVDVTVVEFLDEVLAAFDSDIIEEISKIAKSKGIKIFTGSKVEQIIQGEDGQSIVVFSKDNEKKYISADKVLMAVGRQPSLDGLDVASLGLELNDKGRGIKVNEKMQTNIPNIYAIGDVTNRVLLAHVASHQGIVAVKNIIGVPSEIDYNVIPSAIFTDPEIAMVGIGEKAAKKQGIDVEVGKFPFAASGKALTMGESRGFVKIIKQKCTGKILGGAIIGPHATDLIAEIALAVKKGLTCEDVIETVHAHPTTAEAIHEAVLAAEGGAIHFVN
ncbi:dihydrolipoyl dehydrogenase [Biomaibacter acetigenes]|uniref:Dihydrolipoyl dehydrogenase n=1 Tax=Biomaibacter acetigenes TaxID=2316383 RepID=A0A3G2R6Q6_9FIRM|nr:dihydrolipoyl dehydrogenase [Biomaibacter acetigenes]AYO31096.1 dihydrolipoyl dehydrogenase [Biomaibacter acetigenes]